MPEDLSWRDAIVKVLSGANTAVHYTDIANEIVSQQLRKKVGATPARTVNYELNRNIKEQGEKSMFVRVAEGEYILRDYIATVGKQGVRETQGRTPKISRTPEVPIVITAFGMFWRRSLVNWTGTPKLLGQQSRGAKEVDFREQRGVYLLQDGRHVVYVGRATDRSLGVRLLEHTFDRLNGRWDRFSWFGIAPVDDEGRLSSPTDDVRVSSSALIASLEALLIEALEPPQNRRRGDDFRAVEFLQVEDPRLEKDRKAKLLQELGAKL